MNEFEKVLIDSQKEVGKSNKRKDKIIVLLIVLMFLEAIVGYSGFIWYESQFDYVTSVQTVAVTIGTGTTQYPLMTKCGNNVHADQIRSRRVYHTNVATDTASFVVSACELCKTGFNFPTIPVVTP